MKKLVWLWIAAAAGPAQSQYLTDLRQLTHDLRAVLAQRRHAGLGLFARISHAHSRP